MTETFKSIFNILDSPIRRQLLDYLHKRGEHTFSELRKYATANMSSNKFAYHMRGLDKYRLIVSNKRTGMYDLTPTGRDVLDLVYQLECLPKVIVDRDIYGGPPAWTRLI